MRKRASATWLFVLLHALFVPVASGQGRSSHMVIFPLESPPEHVELVHELTQTLIEESKSRKMHVTTAQATFTDTALIAGCAEPSDDCYQRILDQLNADHGVTGTISPSGEGSVKVELVYFRRDAEPVKKTFEVETARASEEAVASVPELLGEPASPSGGSFSVSSVKKSSWIVMGSGGGAMAVGMMFWVLASRQQTRVNEAAVGTVAELERLADLENSAKRRATIGNVFFFGGLTAVTVGALLAYRQGKRSAAEEGAMTFAPMPVQGGMGLSLTVGWSP